MLPRSATANLEAFHVVHDEKGGHVILASLGHQRRLFTVIEIWFSSVILEVLKMLQGTSLNFC